MYEDDPAAQPRELLLGAVQARQNERALGSERAQPEESR